MKKSLILTMVLVLTVSLLTGCGCTRRGAMVDTRPSTEMTIIPTNIPETTAPLLPETMPTTPATEPTREIETEISTEETVTEPIDNARNRIR